LIVQVLHPAEAAVNPNVHPFHDVLKKVNGYEVFVAAGGVDLIEARLGGLTALFNTLQQFFVRLKPFRFRLWLSLN